MKRSEWRVRTHPEGSTPAADGAPGNPGVGEALSWQDEEVYRMFWKHGQHMMGLLQGFLGTIDLTVNHHRVVQATKPFDEYPPNIHRALESLKEYRRQQHLRANDGIAPARKRKRKPQGRWPRRFKEICFFLGEAGVPCPSDWQQQVEAATAAALAAAGPRRRRAARSAGAAAGGDSLADDRRVDAGDGGDGDDVGEVVDGDVSCKALKRSEASQKVAGGGAARKSLKSSARGKPSTAADKPEGMAGVVRGVGVLSGVSSGRENRVAGKGSHRSDHRKEKKAGDGEGEGKAAGGSKAAGGDGKRKVAGDRKTAGGDGKRKKVAGKREFCSTKAGKRSRTTMRCLEQATRERLCEIGKQAEEANRRAVEAKRALVDKYLGILREKLAEGVEEERRMLAEVAEREEAKLARMAGLL
ncbi:unnamed protein product [Closterium sp. NIES-65]|nr:unnamed protein product [Closterium sp. NIES-65]CAI6001148.1 unnamed protein product [Closterium sp. NIES-65]